MILLSNNVNQEHYKMVEKELISKCNEAVKDGKCFAQISFPIKTADGMESTIQDIKRFAQIHNLKYRRFDTSVWGYRIYF